MITNERPDSSVTERLPLPADSVDLLVNWWSQGRPDLDFSPWSALTRLDRVNHHVHTVRREFLESQGVGWADFHLLGVLASFGEDAKVSQARLMEEVGLTSGTMSVRIARLVDEGLVDCQADPSSKRSTVVSFTEKGRELFDRVFPGYLAGARRLLSALTSEEERSLVSLLRKLLVEFEGAQPAPEAAPVLGLGLAPAYVAVTMRESVGLPPAAGLLVRGVDEAGPAAQAGVRPGDLLLRSRGRELRSATDLYAAMEESAKGGRLLLTLLRGTDQLQVTVKLDEARATGTRPLRPVGRSARGEHNV